MLPLGFIFVSLCRRAWTRCTGTWSRVVRPSLHCGLLRPGTATSLKTTSGVCPSGPASTCWSFLRLASLKSSPCEISLMVQNTSGHSRRYWCNHRNILAASQLYSFKEMYYIYFFWELLDFNECSKQFHEITTYKQHFSMNYCFFFSIIIITI